MSFSSGTRLECGKPIDTDSIQTAIDNSEDLITRSEYTGCKASGSRSISTSGLAVNFTGEDYDTDTWHDTVTNNTRFTVPSGIGIAYVQIYVSYVWSSVPSDPDIYLLKNGSAVNGSPRTKIDQKISGSFRSSIISVSDSDYFELYSLLGSGTLTLSAELSIRGFR